ncbi:SLIT-ROBO Rho GTPase-activating protein 2C [Plecturocebus cupreus]
MGFCHVVQAGRELLSPSNRPTSASQSPEIIGVNHCAWPEIRAQLTEQMKCLDQQCELRVQLLQDLQDFFRKKAEIEMDYSRNLEKLAERFLAKTRSTKDQQFKLKCNSMILAHCNLKLLDSSDPPASASLLSSWDYRCAPSYPRQHFAMLPSGLKLLALSNPPTSAFQSAGITAPSKKRREPVDATLTDKFLLPMDQDIPSGGAPRVASATL